MNYEDKEKNRLRTWLIEDTGSESEADSLLPVVEKLNRLAGRAIDLTSRSSLTRLLIQELRSEDIHLSRTIVCIEDDISMIDMVTELLSLHGFEVYGAANGVQGLELIEARKPDLVLLDLVMPDMDGWEVYQRMKADVQMSAVPVIVVSAKAELVDKELGLKVVKVEDYITKPFDVDDLLGSVCRVLGVAGSGA